MFIENYGDMKIGNFQQYLISYFQNLLYVVLGAFHRLFYYTVQRNEFQGAARKSCTTGNFRKKKKDA